jgi:uncharacterized protein YwgA
MFLQIPNYHMANEILYALSASKKTSVGHLSRLTLQKVLYLAGALSPLKDVLLEYLKFNAEKLGPYERNIQNTVDHLVGLGLVDVAYFEETTKGGALTNYIITDTGQEVVDRLIQYSNEEEKAWWISLVTSMIYSYLVANGLNGTVDEKVRTIVYQDPTYEPYRKKNLFRRLIDLSDKKGLTYQLVEFLKEYAKQTDMLSSELDEKKKVSIVLVAFMEYLYTGVLNEAHT